VPDSGIALRPAMVDDLDVVYEQYAQVQALHAEAMPEFFKPPAKDKFFRAHFEKVLKDPERYLVLAFVDGAPAGHVAYVLGTRPESMFQRAWRFIYIHQLVVVESQRRTGCGSAMIDYVKDAARAQGVSQVGIDHWSFNDAARGCFEKNGFQVKQERMWLSL